MGDHGEMIMGLMSYHQAPISASQRSAALLRCAAGCPRLMTQVHGAVARPAGGTSAAWQRTRLFLGPPAIGAARLPCLRWMPRHWLRTLSCASVRGTVSREVSSSGSGRRQGAGTGPCTRRGNTRKKIYV